MQELTKTLVLPVHQICDNWKENKVTRHSMHNLCSRICSFPPSIPSYFIQKYTKEGEVVFDMWSGKGSVPFEALRNNRIGIGNDKSPEAFIFTHAKVRPIRFEALNSRLLKLKREMAKCEPIRDLTDLDRKASVFYSKKTFEQILRCREVLFRDWSVEGIFIKAIILGILHGNSTYSLSLRCSHSYSMSSAYVKKYAKEHHLRRPSKNIVESIMEKGTSLLLDPLPRNDGKAINNDSTNVDLKSDSVDMVLTSPPYFDIQTYAWCNWLRLWFLGHDYRDVRKTLAESGSIPKYGIFMKDSIKEIFRILKPGARAFIVVGDVVTTKGKQFINTADFLKPLCEDAGFSVEMIVVDNIPRGRRVMTYIPDEGGIKTERILYLKKSRTHD